MELNDKKRKIGIDIDEVVVCFMEGYLKFHNKKYNSSFKLTDIVNYSLWKSGFHSSKEESVMDVVSFSNSSYFDSLGLVEGAKSSLEKIFDDYNVLFITARSSTLRGKTESFFKNNFSKNGYSFIFSGEIYGGKTKGEICNDFGIQTMIEDNRDYALDCAKKGVNVFLLDKPWNKDAEEHENIIRVKNWKEIMEKLK